MASDPMTNYKQASEWTLGLVRNGAAKLGAHTPCDDWDVRTLINHMIDTQRYFADSARGKEASPPGPTPPDVLSDDPADHFAQMRAEVIAAFSEPDAIERTGPSLGIAFSDQLLHGWDLASATEQDATMPDGLAEAAYAAIHGMFNDVQRKGIFKPERTVPADVSAQERLLAYTGR